jgi:hypothetical protein
MRDHVAHILHIGISSWIIKDGNYGDFAISRLARFALEFWPLSMRSVDTGSKIAESLASNRYHVRGQVVFTGPGVWVIDVGPFMAYHNHAPAMPVEIGTWVEGDIDLGVDPIFYFKDLHKLPGIPPLRYEFVIHGIMLETTPWIASKDEQGREVRRRDERQQSFVSVAKTNAEKDDGGHAHYVLECERIGGPDKA